MESVAPASPARERRELICLSRSLIAYPLRSRGGERALFVVRDDDGEVLACAGVEPQYFVGNAILVRPS